MAVLGSGSTIIVVPVFPLTHVDADRFISELKWEANSATEPPRAAEPVPHLVVPWVIRNKYYTARVQFRTQPLEQGERAHEISAKDEPAVVVLADASQESPPDTLRSVLESLSARVPEFDVALLVTVHSSAAATSSSGSSGEVSAQIRSGEQNEDAWDSLALDWGFEWVNVARSRGSSRETVGNGHDDEGFGRIRDALESHMWEGMARVPKKDEDSSHTQSLSDRADVLVDAWQDEDDSSNDLTSEEDSSHMGVPPLPQPRPFVPSKLEFPTMFLPSIPRQSTAQSRSPPAEASPPKVKERIPSCNGGPLSSFEDDFSPFVGASSSSSFAPALFDAAPSPHFPRSIQPNGDLDHSGAGARISQDDEASEHELESLDNLFEQIRFARQDILREEEEGGLETGEESERDEERVLRRRRERAEQLMHQVFGSKGLV